MGAMRWQGGSDKGAGVWGGQRGGKVEVTKGAVWGQRRGQGGDKGAVWGQ